MNDESGIMNDELGIMNYELHGGYIELSVRGAFMHKGGHKMTHLAWAREK